MAGMSSLLFLGFQMDDWDFRHNFRLRMLASRRGVNISKVAEDVLDKALPKWDGNRGG